MLRVPAVSTSTATAIFCHGLGDSGNGLKFLASESHKIPELEHITFVLPTAPIRHFPALGGATTGWFDFAPPGDPSEVVDVEGIEKSAGYLNSLIEEEIAKGTPPSRILIGGFSQGAMLCQVTAFTSKHKLAGIVSLSGKLPMLERVFAKKVATNLRTPIFIGHGTDDLVVPFSEFGKSLEAFKEAGFKSVEPHAYESMGHSLCPEEFVQLGEFMKRTLPSI